MDERNQIFVLTFGFCCNQNSRRRFLGINADLHLQHAIFLRRRLERLKRVETLGTVLVRRTCPGYLQLTKSASTLVQLTDKRPA